MSFTLVLAPFGSLEEKKQQTRYVGTQSHNLQVCWSLSSQFGFTMNPPQHFFFLIIINTEFSGLITINSYINVEQLQLCVMESVHT